MKKLYLISALITIIILLQNNSSLAQEMYGYFENQKRTYVTSEEYILVKLKDKNLNGLEFFKSNLEVDSIFNINVDYDTYLLKLKIPGKNSINATLKGLENLNNILFKSPIILDDEGNVSAGFTNEIIVRLKSKKDYFKLEELAKQFNITEIRQYEFDELTFFLKVDIAQNELNPLTISNKLHETKVFEYSEPNFFIFLNSNTSDQFYNSQWALNNTGQGGGTIDSDMDVPEAWGITTGCNQIITAVLDIGVELNHPDLVNNLVTGFDATNGGSNGAPLNNTGDSAHGTACAGIIAAESNSIGIAGVAYSTRVMPIRIARRSAGWTTTESAFIASGIDWARINGADIMSMSFSAISNMAVQTAITNATTLGRNNLGSILFVATGNANSSSISYPSSNTNVIAVGASSPCDQRKSPTSCDGETHWGSNYGTGLDLVAPGVKIYTTDLQGANGYNTGTGTLGNYIATFNGTSSATPNASAVMALILSVNPNLTQTQARQILESNTDKISGYSYSTVAGQPNGTWNNEVGYGRVNANKAVRAASGGIITGPDLICLTNTSYSLSSPPIGMNVLWNVSPSYLFASTGGATTSGNSTTATIRAASSSISGQGVLTFTLLGECPVTVSKSIWVGVPQSPSITILGVSPYGAVHARVEGNSNPPYKWYVNGSHVLTTSTKEAMYIPGGSCGQTRLLAVSTSNSCGETFSENSPNHYFTVPCSMFNIYPNPASNELNINIDPESLNQFDALVSDQLEIGIYDNLGDLLFSGFYNFEKISIDVSKLKVGTYFIHIKYKEGIIRRQIKIQR